MVTKSDVNSELDDHIPSESGIKTPDSPNRDVLRGAAGQYDSVPEGVVGEVVLRVLTDANGDVVGWETMEPAVLADKIKKIDSGELSESDVFSDDYLTQWRSEGRNL